ncbi:MAG: efflux transporter outer membrane subunit [Oceanospirillaceae bacterium]|nr:efflux transporter outer membrane subunit [Oceanospirillaceae bacterium]
MFSMRTIKNILYASLVTQLIACTTIGPNFEKPAVVAPEDWSELSDDRLDVSAIKESKWWLVFNDPILNQLVDLARAQNNSLEIAGLRVLEAQAQLGIATGQRYPQSQVISGSISRISPAKNLGNGANYSTYGLGAGVSWELDFWGRFTRGIESADAAFMSSMAARDQVMVLLTAQVVDTYTIIRITEEQIRIAHDNETLQKRSYDIARVLFRNGSDSELDMQQAKTLLLSTQATVPGFNISLRQAHNALSILLGKPPGAVNALLTDDQSIPVLPATIEVGIPVDLLRRRPDVRQAELDALAQNARVGFAETDLYPRFSLFGSIGLASGGPSGSSFGDLFGSDALTYSFGPSFYWPFLNYDRIVNNVRVQDSRLQQALVRYRETVITAYREAEDAMASLKGTQQQAQILIKTVASAKRSAVLSTLRYKEGFSQYQRVLDSQQALFRQQQNLVSTQGASVRSLIALYKALGGGWEDQTDLPIISPSSREQMNQRTNWGELLEIQQSQNDNNISQ